MIGKRLAPSASVRPRAAAVRIAADTLEAQLAADVAAVADDDARAGHGDVAHTHRHARKTSAGFAVLALRDGCRGLLVDADAIDR